MAIDPENVRVDLLRIKRKLYISYPEGSKERSDFLYASKLSELTYLQKLIDPQVVDIVFDEYDRKVRSELLNIAICFGLGACFSVMLVGFHQLHPTNFWLSFYTIPLFVGMVLAGTHVMHLIQTWKSFQPFRKEYAVISGKIDKLLNELKGFKK